VSKLFGDTRAVVDLNLDVSDREFVTLLGPSGCGKTTTLRLIAGFIPPDDGTIEVDGELLSSRDRVVPPERRRMGMVFQNYAVWPHKTVFENVAFGLEVQRRPRTETTDRVHQMLDLVGLTGLDRRYPAELSGGQQQRVALARSLVVEPRILLLDEPLSNLDARLRERMRSELKQLQRRIGITFIYVTHDQSEAMALSDRVAVMDEGRLQQIGTPREVYQRPANRVVADFMGLVNLLPATLEDRSPMTVQILPGPVAGVPVPAGGVGKWAAWLMARPETLRLLPGDSADGFPGRIEEATFLGNAHDYLVAVEGAQLRIQAPPDQIHDVGDRVRVLFDGRRCTLIFE